MNNKRKFYILLAVMLCLVMTVSTIFTGGCAPKTSSEPENLMGAGNDLATFSAGWFADKLAGSLTQYAAGKFIGWGLSQMGFGSKPDANILYMKGELDKISNQLINLEMQMTSMQQALTDAINKLGYDTRLTSMQDTLTAIDNISHAYMTHMDKVTKNKYATEEDLNTAKNNILKSIKDELLKDGSDVTHYQDIINKQLIGVDFTISLMGLWNKVVMYNHRFMTAEDSRLVQNHFDTFDTRQQWLCTLLVEYFHCKITDAQNELNALKAQTPAADPKQIAQINSDIATYQNNCVTISKKYAGNLEAQKKLLLTAIPDGLFVDSDNGRMWIRKALPVGPMNPNTGEDYKTTVAVYVHGDLNQLNKDKSGNLFPPNPDSPLNKAGTEVNYGFHDWVLPTLAELNGLMNNCVFAKDADGITTSMIWFADNGAFPDGSTLDDVFGERNGGRVWTRDWYWAAWLASEVVNVKNLRDGSENPYEILTSGIPTIAFPVRVVTADERFYIANLGAVELKITGTSLSGYSDITVTTDIVAHRVGDDSDKFWTLASDSTFDLADIQNKVQTLGQQSLIPGDYDSVTLKISDVLLTTDAGKTVAAKLPEGGITLTTTFNVANGFKTSLNLQFDSGQFIGSSGEVKPAVKLVVSKEPIKKT